MVPKEAFDPERLSKDFTDEERKAIVEGAKVISHFDDIMLFVGKHGSDGRTATTAMIFAKETFQGQVAERLLEGLPGDWKKNLTLNASGLDLVAALRGHWMAFLNGPSVSVRENIEKSFDELEKLFKSQTL